LLSTKSLIILGIDFAVLSTLHASERVESMWKKDWADAAVVIAWVAAWSMLVYFVPLNGL
ncbi:hypothetical protein OFC55_33450, partial [Escherichia coli]|nr:hypothetical protein [Escherichia coli]